MLAAASAPCPPPASKADVRKKQAAAASIDAHRADLVSLADQVWAFAETALRETRSAALLADYAEEQGFRVERGVAGHADRLRRELRPGPAGHRRPRRVRRAAGALAEGRARAGRCCAEGAPGHGCGHNLFGAASLGAAIAVKELIAAGKLAGTVRFYGTPAEEAIGGKVYMVREGLFQDVDVALAWHPADRTRADMQERPGARGHDRRVQGPHRPRRLRPLERPQRRWTRLELFTHGVNMMREHVKPTVRMHYVILDGGDVPNVVPDHAKVWLWARDFERTGRRRRAGAGAQGRARARRSWRASRASSPSRPATTRSWSTRRGRGSSTRTCAGLGPDRLHAGGGRVRARAQKAAAGVEPRGHGRGRSGRSKGRSRRAARPTWAT